MASRHAPPHSRGFTKPAKFGSYQQVGFPGHRGRRLVFPLSTHPLPLLGWTSALYTCPPTKKQDSPVPNILSHEEPSHGSGPAAGNSSHSGQLWPDHTGGTEAGRRPSPQRTVFGPFLCPRMWGTPACTRGQAEPCPTSSHRTPLAQLMAERMWPAPGLLLCSSGRSPGSHGTHALS